MAGHDSRAQVPDDEVSGHPGNPGGDRSRFFRSKRIHALSRPDGPVPRER